MSKKLSDSFKKEWTETELQDVKRRVLRYCQGKWINFMRNNSQLRPTVNTEHIDNTLGLAYVSSGVAYAGLWINNLNLKFGTKNELIGFALSEDNTIYGILWDENENESYVKL